MPVVPGRKKGELEQPFDYEQAHAELVQAMQTLHISRVDEMPRIELYLDQVLSIVTTELAPLYEPGEKIITGSMVNNYVKQRVMPAPTRKRYTRRHLASLLFVCSLKRVLSIAQVAQVLTLCREAQIDLPRAYDSMCSALEHMLGTCFTEDIPHVTTPELELYDISGQPVTGQLAALLHSSLGLIVNSVYVEKLLALEARRPHAEALER